MILLLKGVSSSVLAFPFNRPLHDLDRDFDNIELLLVFAAHPFAFIQDLIPFLLKFSLYQLDQLFISHLELLNPPQELDVLRLIFVEILLVPFPLADDAFPQRGHAPAQR